MYSIHSSNEKSIFGAILTLSSVPDERTFVNFFPLIKFTPMSVSLLFSPTTCPIYMSWFGSIKKRPLSCNLSIAYAVAFPAAEETMAPLISSENSPLKGPYSENLWFMIAVPAVAVKILFRNPISPLEGIVNSKC